MPADAAAVISPASTGACAVGCAGARGTFKVGVAEFSGCLFVAARRRIRKGEGPDQGIAYHELARVGRIRAPLC
jgi:hypothetical protein